MTLSNFFLAIYRQYKEDTKHIVDWLSCTARAYGFNAKIIQPDKGPRLKGKASAEAKKQPEDYPVTLNDFEPMARFLIEKSKEKVPHLFASALARAIQGRLAFRDELERSRD